jgi:hypothetical protein
LVVKAHAIEGSAILGQLKQARFGVARLGLRSDGAHLYKTKPQAGPDAQSQAIFVEARSQPKGIGKGKAPQRHR